MAAMASVSQRERTTRSKIVRKDKPIASFELTSDSFSFSPIDADDCEPVTSQHSGSRVQSHSIPIVSPSNDIKAAGSSDVIVCDDVINDAKTFPRQSTSNLIVSDSGIVIVQAPSSNSIATQTQSHDFVATAATDAAVLHHPRDLFPAFALLLRDEFEAFAGWSASLSPCAKAVCFVHSVYQFHAAASTYTGILRPSSPNSLPPRIDKLVFIQQETEKTDSDKSPIVDRWSYVVKTFPSGNVMNLVGPKELTSNSFRTLLLFASKMTSPKLFEKISFAASQQTKSKSAGVHSCDHCGLTFKSYIIGQNHRLNFPNGACKPGVGNFLCPRCRRKFIKKREFDDHVCCSVQVEMKTARVGKRKLSKQPSKLEGEPEAKKNHFLQRYREFLDWTPEEEAALDVGVNDCGEDFKQIIDKYGYVFSEHHKKWYFLETKWKSMLMNKDRHGEAQMSFASDSYTLIDLDTAETKVVNDPKNLRESEVGTATKASNLVNDAFDLTLEDALAAFQTPSTDSSDSMNLKFKCPGCLLFFEAPADFFTHKCTSDMMHEYELSAKITAAQNSCVNSVRHNCDICGAGFTNKPMFVMHMVKEHNQKERELLEIKKIFPTKPHPLHGAAVKSLKKDMNVNGPLKSTGESDFDCDSDASELVEEEEEEEEEEEIIYEEDDDELVPVPIANIPTPQVANQSIVTPAHVSNSLDVVISQDHPPMTSSAETFLPHDFEKLMTGDDFNRVSRLSYEEVFLPNLPGYKTLMIVLTDFGRILASVYPGAKNPRDHSATQFADSVIQPWLKTYLPNIYPRGSDHIRVYEPGCPSTFQAFVDSKIRNSFSYHLTMA